MTLYVANAVEIDFTPFANKGKGDKINFRSNNDVALDWKSLAKRRRLQIFGSIPMNKDVKQNLNGANCRLI